MPEETTYSKTKKVFEEIEVGEKISAQQFANRIGASKYENRKIVAAFLSQQAGKGRATKHIGKDKRMYYEKLPSTPKPFPPKIALVKDRSRDTITFGEIGERIVNYIKQLQSTIEKLEKERDQLREEASISTKRKDEFRRLYRGAEQKIKDLSERQPMADKTVRLSRVLGN